jgi:type IV pilus assembly protein PilY1
MEFYTNPPSRGDNAFFSFTVSGTANVTMIYPGTQSMRAIPISLYELRQITPVNPGNGVGTRGCSNSYLNSLQYFMPATVAAPAAPAACLGPYNRDLQYPEPEQAYSGGGGLNDSFESGAGSSAACPAISYTSNTTGGTGGLAWEFGLWPSNDSGTAHTAAGSTGTIDSECTTALAGIVAATGSDFNDCQQCLTSKGYWINYLRSNTDTSAGAFVAKGNWLNFFPPKWAILRLAYKRLVNGPLLNPLREGIGTQNGSAGWFRLQKMLPQSCSGAGRPNQRIGSTDSVTYDNTSNPLAEMLFNVAWTVSSQGGTPPGTWGFFTNQSTHPAGEPGPSSDANKKAGFCPGCNAGFSVMFSDGRGMDGWQNCDSSQYFPLGILDPTFPAYCKNPNGTPHDSRAACSGSTATGNPGLGLGAENDGNDFLDPNMVGGAGPTITQTTAPFYNNSGAACPNDWLASVASWMFATDLASNSTLPANDVPGTNLRLYTVGIGDNYFGELTPLQGAASAGRGLYVPASNFAALETSINRVFLDIISKATSFSVAAITTVQTRGTTFAFIPRFRPLGGAQWEGRLYRFRLFNEFAAGCSSADLNPITGGKFGLSSGSISALNPNANNSCNDIFLEDSNNNFVGEDDGGSFILLDNSQAFGDAGWPPKSPKTVAAPIWEAANIMLCRENNFIAGLAGTCDDGGTTIATRKILTVPLDAGVPIAGTALITYNDFSDAGIATMTDYMKLSGVNSDFCKGLSSTSRHNYVTEQDCGKDLMKFIDGQDVLRQNTDGGSARPNILGDIFHSSPILVTPPAPSFLCDTGIISQCVRTLYAEDTSGQFTPNSKSSYNTYLSNNATRPELILVGADDGMLHAFQAGTALTDGGYDDGTGVEVWSFIPPDMLPKLQRYALSQSHNVLVDGTPWVRDIWKDGSGGTSADQKKQVDEFHTVAIIGEREGGRRYTAIDVTDTANPPKFLWTWPPPGSRFDMAEGESWNDTTPNPPPIGPVLVMDSSGPISITVGGGAAIKASERWIVAISGGYDPNLVRGRAVYILDAWDGTLLYKFSRYDDSGTCSGKAECLLGSVAAPVSMVDSNFDNFFDMAVVGDTDGQLWTIDMLCPGGITGSNCGTAASPGISFTNWFGGLTFQQFKAGTVMQRAPFFTMAGARTFEDSKGGVRAYLGSGDRDQIKVRDTDAADGGTCAVDNLRGCLRNNCTVDVQQNTYQIGSGGTVESFTGEWQYTAGNSSPTTNTFTLGTNTGTAGACNDPAQVALQYTANCGGTLMTDPTLGTSPVNNTMLCDFDGGNDAGEECTDTSGKPLGANAAFTSPTITNTRFYSIKLFTPLDNTTRPRMVDTSTQSTYNSHTLTDTDLTDVSTDAGMSADAGGWRLTQSNDQNEKTASAALLLGGCVAWNTELPSVIFTGTAADGGQVCAGGSIPADTAFLYQANDDTGVISCGLAGSPTSLATVRFQQRSVTVTPQQPTPVVSLNAKTGQAGYSGISLEPGGKIPLQISVGAAGVQGDISWLDVGRNLHNCRHPLDGGSPVCQ